MLAPNIYAHKRKCRGLRSQSIQDQGLPFHIILSLLYMHTPTRSVPGPFRGREWARPTLSAERGGSSVCHPPALWVPPPAAASPSRSDIRILISLLSPFQCTLLVNFANLKLANVCEQREAREARIEKNLTTDVGWLAVRSHLTATSQCLLS